MRTEGVIAERKHKQTSAKQLSFPMWPSPAFIVVVIGKRHTADK